MSSNNNNRVTPEAVRDYKLDPSASVVDKQAKYTPQLENSAKLKATADGLQKLAKGINDVRYVVERQANDNSLEAMAKTADKNKKDWAEVSKNIDGMAKFNPYNKEAFYTLRAKELSENGMLKLNELKATCASLTPEEFEKQSKNIQDEVISNMDAEGLKAKHTAGYLLRFQNTQIQLKSQYVAKNAEFNYNTLQNQMITSTSKDFATLTHDSKGYAEGWNKAVKNLTDTANGLGMNNTKQAELFTKAVNQYLVDNVEDIDAEKFILAVGQTKINGQPLSDFDPNYAETMKELLVKAKRAKYDNDKMDLDIEKLRLEKATLNANADMFKLMADPNATDAQILNKANELINAGGMQSVGFQFLHSVLEDKNTLLTLRTTTTKPATNDALMGKYITGTLTQGDIVNAFQSKNLSARDASSFFKALQSDAQQSYSEQLTALKELYLDKNSVIDLGEKNRADITKSVYNTLSDSNLTTTQKAQAFSQIKGVAERMDRINQLNKSKDPKKLLTANYMRTQHAHTQSAQEAQRYLAQIGFFRNQAGWKDSQIRVSSPMQQARTVTGTNGKTVTREHKGTDVTTYTGRTIVAPRAGTVVASGFEKTMGNYVLFKCDNGGFIKLMHLQSANLPRAGMHFREGNALAHVGNTGYVTSKNTGILHIECFDKNMRLVDPAQFVKGK